MPGTITTTWIGNAGNSNFNVAQNWSAGTPTATSDASINGSSASPLTIAIAAGTDAAATLATTFTTLDLSGGTLSIGGASTLDALDQSGGLLDFANSEDASSSFTGPVNQTAGTLEVDAGSLNFAAAGALAGTLDGVGTLFNGGTLALDGLTAGGAVLLENAGTVTLAGGNLTLGDGDSSTVTLQNDPAGTFDITGDSSIDGGSTLASVTNAGLLEKSGGTGVSSISALFTNSGEVLANSGTLSFLSTNTYGGMIDGAGTVAFDAPSNTLGADVTLTVAAVALGGTLDLAADIAYGGVLFAFGHAIELGSSTLTLSNAADNLSNASVIGNGTLMNDDTLAVDGLTVGGQAVLENQGTSTLAGGTLALGDGPASTVTLQNDTGAVFDITGDGSVSGGSIDGFPGVSIVNDGTFEKSGGTGTSDVDAPFGGSGVVFANSGLLAFLNSNSYTGTISGTGAVGFDGITNTLAAGLVLGVATVQVGGMLILGSDLAYAGVVLASAGVISLGTHTLTLSNAGDDLQNAQVSGTGTLKNAAALTADGMVIGGGVLFDNTGTATLGTSSFQLGDSATSDARLVNEVGAVFDITGGVDILAGADNQSPGVSISSAGLFEETGGAEAVVQPTFNSSGTVLVSSGVLTFAAGGTYGGTIDGSGMIVLGGASNTLKAGVVLTIATFVAGGLLAFEGDLSFSGQLLAPGQTLMPNGHTLTLDNGLDDIVGASVLGGGAVVNSATLVMDDITVGGSVALLNEGILSIAAAVTLGDSAFSTASMTNDLGATLEMLSGGSIEGGAAFNRPDVSVVNYGLVQASGGQLELSAPFSNPGTVLATGADLTLDAANDLSAGTLGGGTWDATGTIAFASGGAIADDAARITLNGAGSALLSTPAGGRPLALESTLTSIAAGGVLALLNGRNFASQLVISDAGTIELHDGTLGTGSLTIQAGGTLGGFGGVAATVSGAGLIDAIGGELVLDLGGSGSAVISPGATLELASQFSGNVTIDNGGTATMALEAPSDFTGTLDGLVNGDTLDFRNTQITGAELSGSTLLVTIGSSTDTYDLGAPVTGSGLVIQADTSGTGSDLVVSSASFALAVAKINTQSPINLGKFRVGAAGQTTLSVTNAAMAPAEGLDATITPFAPATALGSIDLLPAGQTDAVDLTAGLASTVPGVDTGSVVVGFFSDGVGTSGNGKTALPSQTLAVTGTFYALAEAAFTAPSIVHAGGSGTFDLAAENVASPTAFAEALVASVLGASGAVSASGTSGLVAAGSTDTSSLNLELPTTAGIVSGTVTIDVKSDGAGTDGAPPLDLGDRTVPVTVTVDNFAAATIEKTNGAGNLVLGGGTVTLDFGTVAVGSAALTANLDVLNSAAGPADQLSGSFIVGSGTAFTNVGFAVFYGVTAGAAGGASSITFTPDAPGAFNETITLAPAGSNTSGFSGVLPDETLVVLGAVAAAAGLAQPQVNTASPISFGAVREGAALSDPVSVSNIAAAGAQALDVTAAASGDATVSGTIDQLAADSSDASSIMAGLGSGAAGVEQGSVALLFASDNGGGTVTPLAGLNETLDVTGTIYAEAGFGATPPAPALLHVGDPGTGVVVVHNTAPAPYAENLDVTVASTSGLGASAAGIGALAPQSSADVPYTIDTAFAGTIDGKIGLDFSSDGTGIDDAGPTPIGTQTVTVAATVNNFATATLQASAGRLMQNGSNYTLDFGTVGVGAAPQTADLIVLNSAIGPADYLSGALTVGSDDGFVESGTAAFAGLQAGGSVDLEQLTLDPTTPGVYTATFALQSTDANVSGYSKSLPGATVTVQETVGTGPAIFATVLGAGGSTVTIPFTTVANAAAAQIALNGISNAVLAEEFTQLDYDGTDSQTAAAPQIGLVELNASTVPLAPLVLGSNSVAAVLNGAASQVVSTGILGNDTVVSGSAGGGVVNLGTQTEVFFGGGGNQVFAEADLGPIGFTPSAEVWLDGNATFDDSAGNTQINIATVPGGVSAIATALTVSDYGSGTTTIDIGSDMTGTAESDAVTFVGIGSAATTVNAAGSAGAGGVELLAFVGTGSGFINGNGSKVILFGGSTGAVTLLGGTGSDIDAGAGGLIEAGTAGGSMLYGSTVAGSTTLVGGGDGDRLYAISENTAMIAGIGNESLYAFAPSKFEGLASGQMPGAVTLFQAETGGNTYITGSGQTSIASALDSSGGNLFQEGIAGAANSATISGFVSGMDSISGADPAGGDYALVLDQAPGSQQMSLSVNGSTSTLTFGDGTTWTFNGVVQVSDFINVASRGGV